MIINSGNDVHYPVRVIKLMRQTGDLIKSGSILFEYEYTSRVQKGAKMEWVDEKFIANFESEGEGVIKRIMVRRNQNITGPGVPLVDIEEDCTHEIQFSGMCVDCGKDMEEVTYMTTVSNTQRATINMMHGTKDLKVSAREASRTSVMAMKRLLGDKKLSLVVDLDQTIIHAVCDPTVAEWQKDASNPNHEAVKDVQSFELNDEGPNSRASTYYIKCRPGLAEFLDKMAKVYELHIYTMGTRSYAENVAKIVDPTGRFFGDRILSRDESGSMAVKNLSRLFPVDTKMVVIIDDRGDVWTWSPNLVRVKAYVFYVGIGDINSSFLPKLEDSAASVDKKDPTTPSKSATPQAAVEKANGATDDDEEPAAVDLPSGELEAPSVQVASHLQAEAIAAQVEERPLMKKQEALDKQDDEEAKKEHEIEESHDNSTQMTTEPETTTPPPTPPANRHPLLRNDDDELSYLTNHLSYIHKIFYSVYEAKQVAAIDEHEYDEDYKVDDDLSIIPDVALIMPPRKLDVLRGVVICFTGVIPQGIPHEQSDIGLWALSFGAKVNPELTEQTTHVVADPARRTSKVRQAAMRPKIRIVDKSWLSECFSKWIRVPEKGHIIENEPDAKLVGALPDAEIVPTGNMMEGGDDTNNNIGGEMIEDDVEDFEEEFVSDSDSDLVLDNVDFGAIDAEFDQEDFDASDSDDDDDQDDQDDGKGEGSSSKSDSSRDHLKRKREESDAASVSSTNNDGEVASRPRGSDLQQRKKRSFGRTSSLTEVQNAADLDVPRSAPGAAEEEQEEATASDDEAINLAIQAALQEDEDDEGSSETAQEEAPR